MTDARPYRISYVDSKLGNVVREVLWTTAQYEQFQRLVRTRRARLEYRSAKLELTSVALVLAAFAVVYWPDGSPTFPLVPSLAVVHHSAALAPSWGDQQVLDLLHGLAPSQDGMREAMERGPPAELSVTRVSALEATQTTAAPLWIPSSAHLTPVDLGPSTRLLPVASFRLQPAVEHMHIVRWSPSSRDVVGILPLLQRMGPGHAQRVTSFALCMPALPRETRSIDRGVHVDAPQRGATDITAARRTTAARNHSPASSPWTPSLAQGMDGGRSIPMLRAPPGTNALHRYPPATNDEEMRVLTPAGRHEPTSAVVQKRDGSPYGVGGILSSTATTTPGNATIPRPILGNATTPRPGPCQAPGVSSVAVPTLGLALLLLVMLGSLAAMLRARAFASGTPMHALPQRYDPSTKDAAEHLIPSEEPESEVETPTAIVDGASHHPAAAQTPTNAVGDDVKGPGAGLIRHDDPMLRPPGLLDLLSCLGGAPPHPRFSTTPGPKRPDAGPRGSLEHGTTDPFLQLHERNLLASLESSSRHRIKRWLEEVNAEPTEGADDVGPPHDRRLRRRDRERH